MATQQEQVKWKAFRAFINNAPCIWVITNGKWGAPTIAKFEGPNAEAEAKLAAAAPELLEALKWQVEKARQQNLAVDSDVSKDAITKQSIAAIAKAERGA